jgi:hypothetical protein
VSVAVNVDVVRDLVSVHLPEVDVADVIPCGEGQDNVAFDVNGEVIVRFRKAANVAERAALVTAEARLLEEIASALPVAVPAIEFVDEEHGCLAYRKLRGGAAASAAAGDVAGVGRGRRRCPRSLARRDACTVGGAHGGIRWYGRCPAH